MSRILVVDDDESIRYFLEILLKDAGHSVDTAASEAQARERFSDHELVITDLKLGRESGLNVLRHVKATRAKTEVIVMTAYATTEAAIQATKLGAHDFVTKSAKWRDELLLRVAKALERQSLAQDVATLRAELEGRSHRDGLVGRSAAIQAVKALIEKVAPTRSTVLILGESGTGKELVARALHAHSGRTGPFVPINCGAIPEGLIESELFGHVKGAFTGAAASKAGLFQAARGGTLFLDEIAELPLQLQPKLLRALQERRVRPIGATEDEEVDTRVVAATNRDLVEEVAANRFREDLYYRLNVIQVRVPPLRERREDVVLLAEYFLRRFAAEQGRPDLALSREARRRLDDYNFAGNVRELQNLMERAAALADGPEVTVDALPSQLRPPTAPLQKEGQLPPGFSLEAHLSTLEQELIERALLQASGVKKNAAALLGLTFRQFRHRLKKLSEQGVDSADDADDPEAQSPAI